MHLHNNVFNLIRHCERAIRYGLLILLKNLVQPRPVVRHLISDAVHFAHQPHSRLISSPPALNRLQHCCFRRVNRDASQLGVSVHHQLQVSVGRHIQLAGTFPDRSKFLIQSTLHLLRSLIPRGAGTRNRGTQPLSHRRLPVVNLLKTLTGNPLEILRHTRMHPEHVVKTHRVLQMGHQRLASHLHRHAARVTIQRPRVPLEHGFPKRGNRSVVYLILRGKTNLIGLLHPEPFNSPLIVLR